MHPQRIPPGPGQESVWDYPRPPAVEDSQQHITILFNGLTLVDTHQAKRVLETSHPPVYYFSPADVRIEYLTPTLKTTFCEWKGIASYYTLTVGNRSVENVAWCYQSPNQEFLEIKNYFAFYPSRMDACYVDGEKVSAQSGDFYGGWITRNIIGPFKGEPGSWGW
jgi:uncharacterized protein (DUF427 family)